MNSECVSNRPAIISDLSIQDCTVNLGAGFFSCPRVFSSIYTYNIVQTVLEPNGYCSFCVSALLLGMGSISYHTVRTAKKSPRRVYHLELYYCYHWYHCFPKRYLVRAVSQ
jgi:hypothetical protein